jgi:transcriptional regulator
MYIPDHFLETDPAEITAIMQNAPLAAVVYMGPDGLTANHLPLLAAPDGRLMGHIALANDMHRHLADGAEVLVILRGGDAYISPSAYPSKQVHHRHVPTWNYQAVHITARVTFLHDRPSKHRAAALLTRQHERQVNPDTPWKMADAPPDYVAEMLDKIVALSLSPSRIFAKSKLSQNREARDAQGVIDDLQRRDQGDVAAKMAAKLQARPKA